MSWVGGVEVGVAGGAAAAAAAEVPAAAAVSLRCCGSTALPFPLSLPLPSTASPSPSMDVTTGTMMVEGPDFPGDCDSSASGGEGGEVVLFLPLLEDEEAMVDEGFARSFAGLRCAKAG